MFLDSLAEWEVATPGQVTSRSKQVPGPST